MLKRCRRAGFIGVAATAAVVALQAPGYSAGFLGERVGTGGTSGKVYKPISSAPATSGSWQVLPYKTSRLAVHSAVLPGGKVLITTGSGNDVNSFAAGTFTTTVWDPIAGTFEDVYTPSDVFCGGQSHLPNGDILIVGGTSAYATSTTPFRGSSHTYVFNTQTMQYDPLPDMSLGRWYPSAISTGSGKVIAVSGVTETGALATQHEVFDPETKTWSPLGSHEFPLYPHMVLMKDGRLFYSGGNGTWYTGKPGIWNALGNNSFVNVPGLLYQNLRTYGATVLLPPAQSQRVMTMGGGDEAGNTSTATTFITDLTKASPSYLAGQPLPAAKIFVSAVILPDSTVFESGGATAFYSQPVYEASIYNPAKGSFAVVNPPSVPRVYHSSAYLLPDGRVATVGGNPGGANPYENRIEIYSPPYLFKGERPTISMVPTEMTYGGSYVVTAKAASGSTLSSFVLVHPSATTHQQDPNQRLVKMDFMSLPTGGTLKANFDANTAPPGWYMLFALDSLGRPSVASWVHLT
jgi:hypothetical protein